MHYCIWGHQHVNEVQTMCQVFYPGEKFETLEEAQFLTAGGPLTVKSEYLPGECVATLYEKGQVLGVYQEPADETDARGIRPAVKRSVYGLLKAHTGFKPPWGNFTGIRPSKSVMDKWRQGMNDQQVQAYMAAFFDMDADKIQLAMDVARVEKGILWENDPQAYSLYVGIPFCPTRCLYCSFTSYPLERYQAQVDTYVDCVLREMEAMKPFAEKHHLQSIYVGGGTPTSLNAQQLDRLLQGLRQHFPTDHLQEITVEAGRPDTITPEKLAVMRHHGVTRLSINPQTMNADTLKTIGRDHTPEQFLIAFEQARTAGFDNINIDLIVGLPGEDINAVANTMAAITPLRPENITVHTLAIKRASLLKAELDESDKAIYNTQMIEGMIQTARNAATNIGLRPYYMYRQKNMVGHFENVGYAKPGYESVYNVQMMGDVQTVLALGAGAVTKLYIPENNRLERFFNVKNVDEYIQRCDEMIQRKIQLNA